MSTEKRVRRIFEKLPETFVPENAQGVKATIQFHLTGDGSGDWLVSIADGRVLVEERQIDKADLTLTLSAADYAAITSGESSAMILYALGRIKADGNLSLVMKFREMFDPSRVDQ
ncbi:MAG TPA: SCP2 sterol-binding domain-containing protein [Anaerolineae bacterium]|nr:SCP2 sterol-binding domain-containing protein [Anaerolineae bacterium]MCB0176665.1 SCP2 sterol-binding domain-containing protein [Anaerolineae bacterium]MCB0225036.1 SCP2 sterol-binding domain-containing protein [Anaerolineae bacterium]MCB9108556.1 SCP2 sterol-binding domain-containing protein [Anaerolineales bacterium]HRV91595.1 SCP2 sterol-binding domain-containing protein [Anaerolineae bacterium]